MIGTKKLRFVLYTGAVCVAAGMFGAWSVENEKALERALADAASRRLVERIESHLDDLSTFAMRAPDASVDLDAETLLGDPDEALPADVFAAAVRTLEDGRTHVLLHREAGSWRVTRTDRTDRGVRIASVEADHVLSAPGTNASAFSWNVRVSGYGNVFVTDSSCARQGAAARSDRWLVEVRACMPPIPFPWKPVLILVSITWVGGMLFIWPFPVQRTESTTHDGRHRIARQQSGRSTNANTKVGAKAEDEHSNRIQVDWTYDPVTGFWWARCDAVPIDWIAPSFRKSGDVCIVAAGGVSDALLIEATQGCRDAVLCRDPLPFACALDGCDVLYLKAHGDWIGVLPLSDGRANPDRIAVLSAPDPCHSGDSAIDYASSLESYWRRLKGILPESVKVALDMPEDWWIPPVLEGMRAIGIEPVRFDEDDGGCLARLELDGFACRIWHREKACFLPPEWLAWLLSKEAVIAHPGGRVCFDNGLLPRTGRILMQMGLKPASAPPNRLWSERSIVCADRFDRHAVRWLAPGPDPIATAIVVCRSAQLDGAERIESVFEDFPLKDFVIDDFRIECPDTEHAANALASIGVEVENVRGALHGAGASSEEGGTLIMWAFSPILGALHVRIAAAQVTPDFERLAEKLNAL